MDALLITNMMPYLVLLEKIGRFIPIYVILINEKEGGDTYDR